MDPKTALLQGIYHSCYPNAAYSSKNELFIIRPLAEHEALTVDYSTLFLGSKELFRCNCGYNGCRRRILGFDQLPVIIQEKYLDLGAVPVLHPQNRATMTRRMRAQGL